MYGYAKPEEQRADVPEGTKGLLLLSTFPEWEREGVTEFEYNKWGIRISGTVFVVAVASFLLTFALVWETVASLLFYVMFVSSIYCLAEMRTAFRNRRKVLAMAFYENGLDMLHPDDQENRLVITFLRYSDIRSIRQKGLRVWVHPRGELKTRWVSLEQIGYEGSDLLNERFGTSSGTSGPPRLVVYPTHASALSINETDDKDSDANDSEGAESGPKELGDG